MTIFDDWAVFFIVLLGIPLLFVFYYKIKKWRAEKIMAQPFPDEWEKILIRNFKIYNDLSDENKTKLKRLILLFLDRKDFEGCGGLEINDEIRVTIAAEAVFLLLGRDVVEPFPNLQTVLVYPHAYVASGREKVSSGGIAVENVKSARLGESWQYGDVVVAWDHAKRGGRNIDDGHNVVFHEFSHQLDQEDGYSDGAPPMSAGAHKTWAHVLSREYKELAKKTERHIKDVIDAYGSVNPAEFFAVSTEAFFEKPCQLKKNHPELFEELKNYYKINPLTWTVGSGGDQEK